MATVGHRNVTLRRERPLVLRARRVRLSSTSIFWRAFLTNASLVTAAVLLLALTPLSVPNRAAPQQLGELAFGIAVLLGANLLLLRISLRPLQRLKGLMSRIDLLVPGERLEVGGADELKAVLAAFNEMLDRLERERRTSSSRAAGREEEERRRVASELHDQVGQGLTALLLQLKTLLAEAPASLRPQLQEAQEVTRANLDEVRRIARRLRPTILDDLGLAYALLALADAAEEQAGLELVRRVDAGTPRLSEAVELALYRIAQEAIVNTLRHADAHTLELTLGRAGDEVRLCVADDGRGMIYAPEVEAGGIRGIRERAVAVGAQLTIESSPGRGTRVVVRAPAERP